MPALDRRLVAALIIALLVTGPLIVFANHCGSANGAACGDAGAYAAYFIAAPLFLLLAVVDIGAAPAWAPVALLALGTFLFALLVAYAALSLLSRGKT